MPEITQGEFHFLAPSIWCLLKCKSLGHGNTLSCCYIPEKKIFFQRLSLKEILTRGGYEAPGTWKGVQPYNLNRRGPGTGEKRKEKEKNAKWRWTMEKNFTIISVSERDTATWECSFLSNLYLFKVLEISMNICLCKCAARVGIDILPISQGWLIVIELYQFGAWNLP